MDKRTWAQRIADRGLNKDAREYQQLKVANEMEREGTAKYHEHLKRKVGDDAARKVMKAKGYDPSLLNK